MNLNINKTTLIIENKKYNLEEIDFILYSGKIRIYKSNGTIETILGGYAKHELNLAYLDIVYSITSINNNFVFIKQNNLINLKNIQDLKEDDIGLEILTKGFNLKLTELNPLQIQNLKKSINQNYNNSISL